MRVYLPPDANCLLSVADHCLRSRDYVNVIVAGKQPSLDFLSMDDALTHCTRGIGIWEWASSENGGEPDVVLACAGDIPTLETVAAAALLREHLPELRVRVVNVVDLMRLQPESEHPHGLPDAEFDALFTTSQPVIFAYHGYPWLIHRLTYRRANHHNLHVRGYKEEGTTTTPFDMVMLNDLDRFHLVMDVIDRVPHLGETAAGLRQQMADERLRHRCLHARARRRLAGRARLDLARLSARPRRQRRVEQPQAVAARRATTPSCGGASSTLRDRSWSPRRLRSALAELPEPSDAVGHRIVHGGERFRSAVRLDAEVLSALRELTVLAPLHQPKSLAAVDAVSQALPDVPEVAASTPPSTPPSRRRRPPTPCRANGASATGCAGSASTASPTPTPRVARVQLAPARAGSSPATSAPARRSARCSTVARSTRRWGSRRSRAW